jgi:hypothetical protein
VLFFHLRNEVFMAENKTKATAVSVDAFIDAVPSDQKRQDAQTVRAIMQRVSGEPATMWGPSIIGFGTTHYVYDSGREGDICRIGFSPRANALTLYINKATPKYAELLGRLGKYKMSKACLYINKLADVDVGVLEQMIAEAWDNSDDCDVC